jgi:hypothetical protein
MDCHKQSESVIYRVSYDGAVSRIVGIIVAKISHFQEFHIISGLFHEIAISISVCSSKGRCHNEGVNDYDIDNYRLIHKCMLQLPPLGSRVRLSGKRISRVWTIRKVK